MSPCLCGDPECRRCFPRAIEMATCGRCGTMFREPADEIGDHPCPRCGPRRPARELMPPRRMQFAYDYAGQWEAESSLTDGAGSHYVYRIGVCDDGTFDVSESDDELIARTTPGAEKIATFDSLDDARDWCDKNELQIAATDVQGDDE